MQVWKMTICSLLIGVSWLVVFCLRIFHCIDELAADRLGLGRIHEDRDPRDWLTYTAFNDTHQSNPTYRLELRNSSVAFFSWLILMSSYITCPCQCSQEASVAATANASGRVLPGATTPVQALDTSWCHRTPISRQKPNDGKSKSIFSSRVPTAHMAPHKNLWKSRSMGPLTWASTTMPRDP